MRRVIIIAGGTGGHVFPALAVADELTKHGIVVTWLGAHYGLEAKLVADRYPLDFVSVSGVRKRGFLAKLFAPCRLVSAIFSAYRVIKAKRPDVVLAMGGYVAAPGGVAAKLARVPLVIHEQNAKAGLTNRLLAKFATCILQAFDQSFAPPIVAKTVGNPLRETVLHVDRSKRRPVDHAAPLRVLVVGGSQGARALNACMIETCAKFPDSQRLDVWHQTGERDFFSSQTAYTALPVKVNVQAFIQDIAKAYAWADVVICRAGAMTVSELAAVGVASILVPYPFAVDQHQYFNARYLSDQGGAILIDQNELNAATLIKYFHCFIQDKAYLPKMAQLAKKLACREATKSVAQICMQAGRLLPKHEIDNGC